MQLCNIQLTITFDKPYIPFLLSLHAEPSLAEMNSQKLVNSRFFQSKRSRLLAFIVLVLILAIIIPPAVVVPLRKKNMGPKSKVLVPLYVYPAPGAWTPLENVYVAT